MEINPKPTPDPVFRRLRRQKSVKNTFSPTWKIPHFSTFYNYGMIHPGFFRLPYARRELQGSSLGQGSDTKGKHKKRIPGALRTRNLTPSTSQLLNLSISQLSSLPLTSERARQKFLGVGGCPGQTPRKFCRVFSVFVRPSHPPQLFCCCVQMHQKMQGLQDIVGDLAKETWFKSWRHVFSPH